MKRFHYSMIEAKNSNLKNYSIFSLSCRNSETLNYNPEVLSPTEGGFYPDNPVYPVR
jgi:hypothetical protein